MCQAHPCSLSGPYSVNPHHHWLAFSHWLRTWWPCPSILQEMNREGEGLSSGFIVIMSIFVSSSQRTMAALWLMHSTSFTNSDKLGCCHREEVLLSETGSQIVPACFLSQVSFPLATQKPFCIRYTKHPKNLPFCGWSALRLLASFHTFSRLWTFWLFSSVQGRVQTELL